jgi:antitoxin component YwqK of YwqJK toxin-antitoxin module
MQTRVEESTYPNGSIKVRCTFLCGTIDILIKYMEWHPNGALKIATNYNEKGQLHGIDEEWYGDNSPKSRKCYENDNLHGRYITWHPVVQGHNTQIKCSGTYANNKKTGRWCWFNDNILEEMCEYKEGKRNGRRETYYMNGQVRRIFNYKDDKLHGSYKCYSFDGLLMASCNYIEGKLAGEFAMFDSDGHLLIRESMDY